MLLNTLRKNLPLALVVSIGGLLAGGCATAYHAYDDPCCCVRYQYCPRPPLPYTTYGGCPTPVAKCYGNVGMQNTSPTLEGLALSESTLDGSGIGLDSTSQILDKASR